VNGSLALLIIVVATAVAFDFTNGFHDTANGMATSIATRALRPPDRYEERQLTVTGRVIVAHAR
jgi:hypothetical protein